MKIQAYIESGIIESYVFGLASEREAAEVERLMRECPEVARAVTKCTSDMERLLARYAVEPPAEVREKLYDWIANHRPPPPHTELTFIHLGDRKPCCFWGRYGIWLLAFIAAVVCIFCVWFSLRQRSPHMWAAAMQQPVIKETTAGGVPLTLYWDRQTGELFIHTDTPLSAPQGMQYRLWALVDGKPVSAGMLEECRGLCRFKKIGGADAFCITLERAGDSLQYPTSPLWYAPSGERYIMTGNREP
ncbi:anti-sigma factor [Chitinophaga lutea]